ncbi:MULTISPECIES: glycosyltransferase [unclassified Paenibacillus]|uniref:4,4'-diaponeurosporenoate glycosyltransferase n=1 Tax=Paenibacillus provencensis TaxID=441151 RepID=A0ABW3PW02_9BACL|nr:MULTISPECIES: glycosyltransferase [unclassified Paenibacillus]MCM3129852.1 glycosyltransferase [Paenibacillus sp. MER 78]SFS91488.1 Glycosyltransferase involved in cell wall bisynthesis [Paenibacillus sp. 453mf]
MGDNNQKFQRSSKAPSRSGSQKRVLDKGGHIQQTGKAKPLKRRRSTKRMIKNRRSKSTNSVESGQLAAEQSKGTHLRHEAQEFVVHEPVVSVIIPAMNEEAMIARVIREAKRVHPSTEVIVVVNGSTDQTEARATAAGARIISYDEALGHDVGRQIGAETARGEVLLFIDGDMLIPGQELKPFVSAVLSGIDVALNDYNGPVRKKPVHPVVEAKHALNIMLGRSDLKGASMTAVPHAISRTAFDLLREGALQVPPLAQAMAIKQGLAVKAVHRVPVGRLNPLRRKNRANQDLLTGIVLRDHEKAVRWLTLHQGSRGGFTDLHRARHLVRAR